MFHSHHLVVFIACENKKEDSEEDEKEEEEEEEDPMDVFYPQALAGFIMVMTEEGDMIYLTENVSSHIGITQVHVNKKEKYLLHSKSAFILSFSTSFQTCWPPFLIHVSGSAAVECDSLVISQHQKVIFHLISQW